MLEHPEIGWIERTGYPSWMQEQDGFCGDYSEAPCERQVERNDVVKIKPADPDSHFKLLPCKCGSDNVAYVHYNGRGGAKWRVTCFDCCHTVDKGCRVRHDAQIAWNTEVSTRITRNPSPPLCPASAAGGDHGENQKRQNDFLSGSCEMLCQPSDYLAQWRGVGNRGVERPGAGGEV